MTIRKYRWSMSQPGNGMIEDDAVKDGWYRSPEVEAALAEKEADWQLKYDLLTYDYEQKWGLSNRLQEQIAVLEMAVKEKDKVIRESCVIIAEGIKVVEGLEKQITDLSAERDNERKIKEAEKKILLDEVTKNKRLREDVRELRRALSNYNPDHEALRGGEVKDE